MGTLLLDISKAFDTIPHQRLLLELQAIGCDQTALCWFLSYLSDRKQRVVTREGPSGWKSVSLGVPQGSCNSPLLFNIFVRELPLSTTSSCLQFADDTTLSESDRSLDVVKLKLARSYHEVSDFFSQKGLSLNATKTQFMVVKAASKRVPDNLAIDLGLVTIPALTSVKLLGVVLDRHLTFAEHVRITVQQCQGLLGALRRAAPSLPRVLLRLAYIALVRTRLEYCCGVFIAMAKTHCTRLEVVQKIASRIICQAPCYAHSAPLLDELRLDTLESRRIKHVCSIVAHCLQGHGHPTLQSYFNCSDDGRVIDTTTPVTSYGRKRFRRIAAQLYNSSLQ